MKRFFELSLVSSTLLLFLNAPGLAQTTSSAPTESADFEAQPQSDASARASEEKQNAPYFFDRWIDGQVTMEGGTKYENVPLKYDVVHNELITKDGDGQEQVLDDVSHFTLGPPQLGNLAWFKRAKDLDYFDAVPDDQFVQVIYQGESYLLAVSGQPAEASTDQPSAVTTQYYYVSSQGKTTPFTPSREAMMDLMKDKKEAVTEFIEETDVDFDNVADLSRLMSFYDQQG